MSKIKYLLALVCLISAVSCSKNDLDPNPAPIPVVKSKTLILNSGNWGSNDASLTVLDNEKGIISTTDIFASVNGKKLGDIANDMIIYGSKLYIAVTNSGVIFVCDLDGKIITEIKEGSPRHFCADKGKVYATLFEGYAAEIDTTTFAVRKVATGPNPEGIACSSGKLYVADSFGYDTSGQYGTTVTVIDAAGFTVLKQLTVNNNPQSFQVMDDGTLYLVSWGNYADIPAALQKINPTTDAVTTVPGVAPTDMTLGEPGFAYLLCSSYDDNWDQSFSYYIYSTKTDTIIDELVSSTEVPNGSFIKYDPVTLNIFIGASDYVSNGDLYVLDGINAPVKYDTGGMNPITVEFIREEGFWE